MTAPVSIVIPTLNSATQLPPCLTAVFEGVAEGIIREVIFADGGSVDGTEALARSVGAKFVSASQGRGGQICAGVEASQGDWVLVLHSDTVLSDGWAATLRGVLHNIDRAYFFGLRFSTGGFSARLVAGWANFRSSILGLPYGDQGLFLTRALYDQVGGYPDIPLMEDVAISRRLRGRKTALFSVTATTQADRYLAEGWARRGTRNLWLLAQYKMGRAPASLARRYPPNQRSEEL